MTKRFIVLLGLMMVAGAVGAEPLVDGDVDAGKQKAAACAACHGPKGNMQSEQFPKLAGQGAPYLYEQLKLFKSGERNNAIMQGQAAGLSDQDMKNVAAYFAAQQMRPGAADKKVAPAGAMLYHGGKPDRNVPACAGCHGPSGLGNAAAKYPRLSGQNPQYIVTQLTAYRDGSRSGYRNAKIMHGVAQELSDADIKALASYIAGLGPARENAPGGGHGALMQNVDNAAAQPQAGASSGSQEKSESSSTQSAGEGDENAQKKDDDAGATDARSQSGDSGAGAS